MKSRKSQRALAVDSLPEEVDWRDEGCAMFPSCLNCPLPRCMEEEPRGKQRVRMSARARRMAELRREGKTIEEIAELFGVSNRTVQRAVAVRKSSERNTRGAI